jgi:hypothetical protein
VDLTALGDALRERNCFEMLADTENRLAIPTRREQLQTLFRAQQAKETELQKKFQALSQQLAEITQK